MMWLLWCYLMVIVNICGMEATELNGINVRPSYQKCQEYIKEIQIRQQKWNQQNIMKTHPRRKNWHDRSSSRRRLIFGVYRGKETRNTEYPHMGALGWYSIMKQDWEFLCGASLISSNFLLTAAHCTKIASRYDVDTSEPTIVRLGTRNIREVKYKMYHDYDIDQIKVHEKYMSPNHNYDIALLKLSRHVKFTKFIHPACLESGLIATHRKYTVTGWGAVVHTGQMVDELRYGEVDLIDQKSCDFYILPFRSRNWNITASHQICAGKMDGSVDTCSGDSGGPLQYKLLNTENEGSMYVIVGITSFGIRRCATINFPSLYTKVPYFIPWIEKIVWPTENRAFYNKIAQKKKVSLHRRPKFKNNF